MSENHALHGAVPECSGRRQSYNAAQISKFQPKKVNIVNTSYGNFTHHESNGVVRIGPSSADKAYIYGGSLVKAFKTALPVIILSLVLIIGAFLAKHYLLTNEAYGGFGSFLFLALLATGGILLVGSLWTLLKIRGEEEVRRSLEVMIKNKRKYNQIHRGNPPALSGRPYLNVRDAEIILTLNPAKRGEIS